MDSSKLICPVCGGDLTLSGQTLRCAKGHCFDLAREGYVNLLRTSRSGDRIGDDKLSARSRRDFLNKGYYAPLRDHLVALFRGKEGSLLDICCGEGYYTSALQHDGLTVYGFDISREMVRLAAKRRSGTYFVANMAAIPVADGAFDYATHLFAPFQEKEFCRILKPGGRLYSVIPGRFHLYGLKQAIYDTPYENKVSIGDYEGFECVEQREIRETLLLTGEDISNLFRMTPYYYKTGICDQQKIEGLESLETDIEFAVLCYKKK